jgi:phosphatidylglycerophosphate synthase
MTNARARGALRLLPNVLTVLRIPLAAAFPFVPDDWRLWVLGAALATEYLDGALARALRSTSRFGRVLDPIADRCLFGAVVATLLLDGSLGAWPLAALGARDVLVAGGALWVVARGERRLLARLHPRLPGKATTVLQYLALFWVLVAPPLPDPLAAMTLGLGVFAAGQYLRDVRRLQRAA